MPPRASRKRPLDQPETPRPTKRVATALASSSTDPQSASNVDLVEASIDKKSPVDIAVSIYLGRWALERDKFDNLQSNVKALILADIFQLIVSESGEKLDPNLQEMIHPTKYHVRWEAFSKSHPDLIDVLLECWSFDPPSFDKILELEYLQKPRPEPANGKDSLAEVAEYKAIVSSWSKGFRGNSADLLRNILRSYTDSESASTAYAPYVPFVQSTGTGKSRMLDELAKSIICIPMNLGVNTDNTIPFPPADNPEFQNWIRTKSDSKETLQKRCEGLLVALIMGTLERLQVIQNSNVNILDKAALETEEDRKSATLERVALLAKEFRIQMSAMVDLDTAQDSEPACKYGEYREAFYDQVMEEADRFVERASETDPTKTSPTRRHVNKEASGEVGDRGVEEAGRALCDFLDPLHACGKEPLVVLCFDEAHSLTDEIKDKPYTCFSEIRRALRALNPLNIFALFLSTGGKFHQFSPDFTYDRSNRVRKQTLTLYPPITEVSFDEFAPLVAADGTWTLDRLASTHHISHLGRVLFATYYDNGSLAVRTNIVGYTRAKLLGGSISLVNLNGAHKLACLSVLMCMDFRGSSWLEQEMERTLVERHMRICLSATPGFKEMFTIAPSEPLLAEAASRDICQWGAAEALLSHIQSSYLSAGDRGEVIVVLLAILAMNKGLLLSRPDGLEPLNSKNKDNKDKDAKGKGKGKGKAEAQDEAEDVDGLKTDGAKRVLRVIDFLEALLPESCHEQLRNHTPAESLTPEDSTERLEDTFKDAHIWFNHFIKVEDFDVVGEDYLWHFIVRGAAIICANNHGGIDILIPILFNNRLLKENVSAILIQVKNDVSFSTTIKFNVFKGMNPFGISRVFSKKVKSHRPIIRMVFALASEQSAISFNPDTPRTTPRPAQEPEEEDGEPIPEYMSFDIWCAGASSDTFRVIDKKENWVYQELLQRTLIRSDPYICHIGPPQTAADRASARRALHPCVQIMPIHHLRFVFDPKDQEEDTKGKGKDTKGKAKASKGRRTAPRAKGPDGRALGWNKTLRPRKA